jgi:hypothetical protein
MDDERFASLLVNAVNRLEASDRDEVLIELVRRGLGSSGVGGGRSQVGPRASFVDALSGSVPVAGERRNVLVRFDAAQHELLRAWCQANGTAMATVLRGLVDRFLRAQADQPGSVAPAPPALAPEPADPAESADPTGPEPV